jgi:hypothetical protein
MILASPAASVKCNSSPIQRVPEVPIPAGGGVISLSQAFVAVVTFAHAHTAIFDLDRRYRAGLLQRKLDIERL